MDPATPSSSRPEGPSTGQAPPDLAGQAADRVVEVVASIRERTTIPALTVVRGVIWGTLATFLVLTALVLLYAIVLRLLVVYLPTGVWSAHLVLGLVFTVAGLVIVQRGRRPADDDADEA